MAGPVAVVLLVAVGIAWQFGHRPADPASSSAVDSGATAPSHNVTAAPSPTVSPSVTEETPSGADESDTNATVRPVQPAWPPLADVLHGVSTSAEPRPSSPRAVPGYKKTEESQTTVRAFSGRRWATVYQFPATMNGCDQQRFYVRWRSLNPDSQIEATWVSTPDLIVDHKPVVGVAGWQSGYGCGQPAFRLRSSSDGSTLADVVLVVQRWEATA